MDEYSLEYVIMLPKIVRDGVAAKRLRNEYQLSSVLTRLMGVIMVFYNAYWINLRVN